MEHLGALMYLASIYEWPAVCSFHAAVLLEIERGRLNWDEYQKGSCSHSKNHYTMFKGEKKWLCHICGACWVKDKVKMAEHCFEVSIPHLLFQ